MKETIKECALCHRELENLNVREVPIARGFLANGSNPGAVTSDAVSMIL